MGQQEVYDFLKRNRSKWYTSKEIAKGLKASVGSVTTCLQKLRNGSDIDSHYGNGAGHNRKNAYVYRFK
jgi:Mn-dependent DtxR family transcriptional regulator